MNKMDQLKNDYKNIEIPEELDFVVNKAIKSAKDEIETESKTEKELEKEKRFEMEVGNEIGRKRKINLRKKLLAAAAVIVIFIGSINALFKAFSAN